MIRMLSLFSGIGAFEAAMKRIGMPHEVVGFSEIDKYAIRSYCAVHGIDEALNLGDITKIDVNHLPNDIDLITYGFPCQDISNAGKMKGMFNADGTQTRSGLFFDALRIIEETQPKIAIAENVKNLTSKKFKLQFDIVLRCLEAAGYNNYWKVLNAKDYGIPQNRERVFIVSIRKDIDTDTFGFPQGFPLELRLKDFLEDEVDEKFYLSSEQTKRITEISFNQEEKDTCSGGNRMPKIFVNNPIKVGNTTPSGKSQCNDVYDESGIYPNICAGTHGNCNPSILVKEATKKGYAEAYEGDSVNMEQPNSKTRRGRVGKQVAQTLTTSPQQGVVQIGNCMPSATRDNPSQGRIYDDNGLSPTLTAMGGGERQPFIIDDMYKGRDQRQYDQYSPSLRSERQGLKVAAGDQRLRIRKLTPKECWRLMGFDDSDFEKAEKVNSNTQLYKQAGNSIVVDVLVYLLRNIKELTYEEKIQDSKI